MRILLSHSADHFDPALPREDHIFWGSSANIISRTLHEVLSRQGNVTYVDAAAPEQVAGQDFDLFVGIARNFGRFLESCEVDRSIMVAVNMHPAEHNQLLLDFVVREKLPTSALHSLDILDVEERARDLAAADAILLFGNLDTQNSYARHEVDSKKIRLANYGSDLRAQPAAGQSRTASETHFLYCASEIGLRKGFDLVAAAFEQIDMETQGAHLHVVGAPSYEHYKARLGELEEILGPRITNHGWLPSDGDEYRDLLDRCDYLFFPSLEEGQAGTVVDAAARGVIPLISRHSGTDFAPLGFLDLETGSDRNAEVINDACSRPHSERERLRRKTLEYYDEFHAGFEHGLEVALDDLVGGSPRPGVSVVLPIHNKASILSDLLKVLDRTLTSYGEVDLCVILDGCSDDSGDIARHFFEGRDDYPVTVLETADVFEVKTNNIGLRRATGRYVMVVQDDNFVYQRTSILEAVTFMEKSSRAVIVGGLAGVNFYPRGTRGLEGQGQIATTDNEVYWRQDTDTDPALKDRIFQVDACMRGPLFFRKAFLEEHGYLDEAFAPLYGDDMDICFRAASVGGKVYCILMDVENESLSQRTYDSQKAKWFAEIMKRNMDLFYSRWRPSTEKDYLWLHRTPVADDLSLGQGIAGFSQRARRRYLAARRRWLHAGTAVQVLGGLRRRLRV